MAMVRREATRGILLVVMSTTISLLAVEAFLKWRPQFQAPAQYERFVFCGASTSRVREHQLFGWTEAPNNAYFEQQSEADGWATHIYNPTDFAIFIIPAMTMSSYWGIHSLGGHW
jgi:hypothetical protein